MQLRSASVVCGVGLKVGAHVSVAAGRRVVYLSCPAAEDPIGNVEAWHKVESMTWIFTLPADGRLDSDARPGLPLGADQSDVWMIVPEEAMGTECEGIGLPA